MIPAAVLTVARPPAGPARTRRTDPPARRGSLRLTRRGRLVLLLGFLALALGLMVGFGGFAAASLDSGSPVPVRVIQVQPGDTLYDIAGQVAKPGQVREVMHQIQELNSLPGTTLEVGQQLAVPRG